MIASVTGGSALSTADHILKILEERRDGQKIRDDANDANLKVLVDELLVPDRLLFLRAKNTGSWLTAQVTTVTVTVLATTEFSGFFLHVMMLPPNL